MASGIRGLDLYTWAEPSSRGTTTYECTVWANGEITCNCPGWLNFRKGTDTRTCKHTKKNAAEAQRYLAMFKAGQPIPKAQTKLVAVAATTTVAPSTQGRMFLDEE